MPRHPYNPLSRKPKSQHEFIYALTCPVGGMVRYVGRTMNNLLARYTSHMAIERGGKFSNLELLHWKQELASQDLKPSISVLEEPSIYDVEVAERRWIQYFQRAGNPMLNVQHMLHTDTLQGYDLWELNAIAHRHGITPAEVSTAASVPLQPCVGFMGGSKQIEQKQADEVARFLYSLPAKRMRFDGISNLSSLAPFFLNETVKSIWS